jgi:hypothetical protein
MEQSPSWEADQFSQLTKKFPAFYGTRRFFIIIIIIINDYMPETNHVSKVYSAQLLYICHLCYM